MMRRFVYVMVAVLVTACASNKSQPVPEQPQYLPVPPQDTRAQPAAPKPPAVNGARVTTSPASVASTGNPYGDTFIRHDLPAIALQPDPQGPRIYKGEKKEDDYHRMLERGYDMMGYSSFEAGDVAPELALQYAREIKADLVLVYSTQSGGVAPSMKAERIRQQALTQDGVVADAPPEAQIRYHYFASYWARLAPPKIGVHVNGPSPSDDRIGLPVVAVLKQSPAAVAGLESGDVLTRIGDIELDKPEKLTAAAIKYAGKTVPLSFRRDGETKSTQLTLLGQPK